MSTNNFENWDKGTDASQWGVSTTVDARELRMSQEADKIEIQEREYKNGWLYLHTKEGCGACKGYRRRMKEYKAIYKGLEWEEVMYKDEDPNLSEVIGELSRNKPYMGFPFVTMVYNNRHHKIMPSEIPYWAKKLEMRKRDRRIEVTVQSELIPDETETR
jgi:hypothetical protein